MGRAGRQALMTGLAVLAAVTGVAQALPPELDLPQLPARLEGTWSLAYSRPEGAPATQPGGASWRLVEVPGRLPPPTADERGDHAWLRVRFRPPASASQVPLALRFFELADADEVFLNGVRIGSTGSFPPGFSASWVFERVYDIPTGLVRTGQPNLLEVHLYDLGGLRRAGVRPAELGPLTDLLRASARRSAVIVGFAVFFAIVGANHLFLSWFLPRPAARPNLAFALFAFVSAVYVALHSELLVGLPVATAVADRVRLALLPVSIALLVVFVYAFFERRLPLAVQGLLGALAVVASVPLLSHPLLASVRYVQLIVAITALLAIPVARVVFATARRSPGYARALAVVLVVYTLCGLWDLARELGAVATPRLSVAGLVFPLGFVPFYVVMALILAHRYWQHYRLATIDTLTGLLRRDAFLERLGEEAERARRTRQVVVAAMLDLDGFKRVNDTVSHAAGDIVLRGIAGILRSRLRPFDVVGRWGGDELCAALVVPDVAEGLVALERVRAEIGEKRYLLEGRTYGLTASIGAAFDPVVGAVDPGRLLQAADRALYRAKAAGGNRVESEVAAPVHEPDLRRNGSVGGAS